MFKLKSLLDIQVKWFMAYFAYFLFGLLLFQYFSTCDFIFVSFSIFHIYQGTLTSLKHELINFSEEGLKYVWKY